MSSKTEIALEASAGGISTGGISIANKMMVAGGSTGFLAWLSQVNWIGWLGVAVAVMGLAANLYFQRRRDKREQAEHQARMDALKDRCGL